MRKYVTSNNGVDTVVEVARAKDRPKGAVTIAAFLKKLAKDKTLDGIIPTDDTPVSKINDGQRTPG